jgi:hypothetical protein
MPLANSTTKPKPARKHPTAMGSRARALRWTTQPGGLNVPGPGSYDTTPKVAGGLFGRFGEGSGKSDIEWEIYRAKQLPGPADYGPGSPPKIGGGRFNLSKPKNEIDLVIYRAKDIPGPGEYENPAPKSSGGRFNMSKAKTDIEWKMYHAAQQPGAGAYDVPDSFGAGGGVNFASKPVRANYQTTMPDAVLYAHNTIQVSPHTACRTDPAMGRQVVSTQRSEPAFSFGGGKTFNMQEHNMKDSLDFAKRASGRRRDGARDSGGGGGSGAEAGDGHKKSKKEEADELFRKFFGYDPGDSSKKGKHAMISKPRGKIDPRPQTTPGPGHYVLPPTMGPSLTSKTAASFSFPCD